MGLYGVRLRSLIGAGRVLAMNAHATCSSRCIIDLAALATLLGISESHLADIRKEDSEFPLPRMLGRMPRWVCGTIVDYIASPAARHDEAPAQKPAAKKSRRSTKHTDDGNDPMAAYRV